jgi:hypothetical protein
MTTTAEIERALIAALGVLAEVIDRWPDFVEAKTKGTPRRGIPSKRRDRETIEEGEGLGAIPAPIHLDILDAMARIVMDADMLHERIAQTVGHPRLEHASSALADPRPFLRYVEVLLPEAFEVDPEAADDARETAGRMRSTILAKLGEVFDGQELDAICPFCVGRTFSKPAGERTLRVRLVPSRIVDGEQEFVVVCENEVGCKPFSAECDMWVKGRPAWPWSQWEWLAERLLPVKVA